MSDAKMLLILSIYNIKLQFRQGFYYAWIFVTIFYICILYFLPPHFKELALPIIMLSEPSTFAMIFTGAIILMERDEKMFENLFITPLPIKTYIYSKMISIAIPATFCTLLICGLNSKFSLKLLLLIPAVSLTTFFFVVFGLMISASAKDIISFIGRIGIFGSVFVLTILDYFGFITGYFHFLLPTKGALVLISMAAGYRAFNIPDIVISLISMSAAIIAVLFAAEKIFYKQIILKGGE